MFKSLSPDGLGLSCSQPELIELALTHKYQGLSIDLAEFQAEVDKKGLDAASRFLKSAPIKIAAFNLPVPWDAEEAAFAKAMDSMDSAFEMAKALGCEVVHTMILPGSNHRPYHESFEFYREHLTTLADRLAELNIRLGIMTASLDSETDRYAYPFISTPDALLALLKMTVSSNLGMLVDAWRWAVSEVSFDEIKSLRPDQVTAVRLADLPPETPLERATTEDRLMPGSTGAVNISGLLRVLGEMEYRGPIMPFVHSSHLAGLKREEAVQKASEAIDQCFQEAGIDRFGKLVSGTAAD